MLRNLQIWHPLWLALTPVLFALFRLTSEHHDASRALLDNLMVLNDRPGELEFLGFVRAKTPTAYRLRVGAHKLVFRETATTRVVGQVALDVPSLLADPSRVQTLIAYRKGTDYEKTE